MQAPVFDVSEYAKLRPELDTAPIGKSGSPTVCAEIVGILVRVCVRPKRVKVTLAEFDAPSAFTAITETVKFPFGAAPVILQEYEFCESQAAAVESVGRVSEQELTFPGPAEVRVEVAM